MFDNYLFLCDILGGGEVIKFKRKKEENSGKPKKQISISKTPDTNNPQPKFIRKEHHGNNTYEVYEGKDAESAKSFLLKKKVNKKLYYIVVETPEGNWGADIEGLYLEHLLPWQMDISSAKCEGDIIPMSWSRFGLEGAAKGFNDNFIVTVRCGKCEHQWLDGIRYQNITIVRCPKCKTLNKIDSKNIEVVYL